MPRINTSRSADRGSSMLLCERIKGPKIWPKIGPLFLKTWKDLDKTSRKSANGSENVQFKPSESTQPKIYDTFATQQQCSVGTDQKLGVQEICRGYIARLHGIQSKSVRTFSTLFSKKILANA
jgi:hypothetical protein